MADENKVAVPVEVYKALVKVVQATSGLSEEQSKLALQNVQLFATEE